jgi:hypothetical protein
LRVSVLVDLGNGGRGLFRRDDDEGICRLSNSDVNAPRLFFGGFLKNAFSDIGDLDMLLNIVLVS